LKVLDDPVHLWWLRRGDSRALHHFYEKYKHAMLGLAVALSGDEAAGEDIVHDVFVAFVRLSPKLELRTSVRSYLLSSVANRVRNLGREKAPPSPLPDEAENDLADRRTPAEIVIRDERDALIDQAMMQLPYDQREIILLHLQSGLKFREIAASLNLSINTAQSRYRYGLQKLRSLLDGKVTP
jgi:RNA polymerase sigma-70 factor (ECF subfamily)